MFIISILNTLINNEIKNMMPEAIVVFWLFYFLVPFICVCALLSDVFVVESIFSERNDLWFLGGFNYFLKIHIFLKQHSILVLFLSLYLSFCVIDFDIVKYAEDI